MNRDILFLFRCESGHVRCLFPCFHIVHCRLLLLPLYFGVKTIDGVRMAVPEKAVLDTLHYYRRGIRFSFDVYPDIDYSRLDKKRLMIFLKDTAIRFLKILLEG